MSYYRARISKLLAWMETAKIDLAIVTSPANVMYLTGFYGDPHERWMGVVVPRQGEPFLYVPVLDRNKAEAVCDLPVHTHGDEDDAVRLLLELLGCDPAGIGRIAIEKTHMSVARSEQVQAHFSGSIFVNAEERLTAMRLQKDEQELALMRRAARLADEAVAFAFSQIVPGRMEYEIVQAIESFAKRQGADRMAFDTMVLAGEKSALPHGAPGTREIRRGDLLLIDLGIVWQGYCSDITRTVAVGEASDRQRAIYEAVRKANEAAIAAVKPGVEAAAVDRAARDVIAEAGFADSFTHRVGHGLGIEIHEPPSVHGKNGQRLLPGTVFTIEPGIYLADVGGVRIEDDVLVTESGAEVLTAYPKELQILPF
ncbi:M24 family metallopeptidase [Effusibacillus pohliae]|uniref:M24 family metallopeptidase n=1 Tax=Effusibacillus pohliae TaxID=232270 RepID=UPI0003678DCA|nr:Xaa-Pro peptidase family protein [Effusibacillus pohliae]